MPAGRTPGRRSRPRSRSSALRPGNWRPGWRSRLPLRARPSSRRPALPSRLDSCGDVGQRQPRSGSSGPPTWSSMRSRSPAVRRRRPWRFERSLSAVGRRVSRSTASQALLGLRPASPRSDGPATSVIMNCSERWKRNASSMDRSWVGLIRSGSAFASANLTWPGSRQANTSKKPRSVPPFAVRRRSKASTAQVGAPVSASVLAAGAGNLSDRSSLRKAFTRRNPAGIRPTAHRPGHGKAGRSSAARLRAILLAVSRPGCRARR